LIYEDCLEEITFNGMPARIYVKHKEYGRMKTISISQTLST